MDDTPPAPAQEQVQSRAEALFDKILGLLVEGAAVSPTDALGFLHDLGVTAPSEQADVLMAGQHLFPNWLVANPLLPEDDPEDLEFGRRFDVDDVITDALELILNRSHSSER